MADHPGKSGPGAKDVRRLVRKQVGKALAALGTGQMPSDEAVHDARKRLKKARAGLRLLRQALGTRAFHRENASLRDAARPLTEVRDAKVLVDTLDGLAEHFGQVVDKGSLTEVRRALLQNKREVRRQVLRTDNALGSVRDALEATRARAKNWPAGRQGRSGLSAGLKRVYRSGREAFAAARDEPTIERLHECRKQAKYLWLQLKILGPDRSGAHGWSSEQSHALADCLGDDHDLAVLRHKLQNVPERFPDRPVLDAVVALIDRRRAELEGEAQVLGQSLYADKPKLFSDRLKGKRRGHQLAAAPA